MSARLVKVERGQNFASSLAGRRSEITKREDEYKIINIAVQSAHKDDVPWGLERGESERQRVREERRANGRWKIRRKEEERRTLCTRDGIRIYGPYYRLLVHTCRVL